MSYFNMSFKYNVYHQNEALLKRINDENKKTKEVLDKIDRGEFKKEKRVDTVAYHRKDDDEGDEGDEGDDEGGSGYRRGAFLEGDTKWRAWVKATGTMQMKKELKNLEWTQGPVGWRKSGVLVEFSDLAFHFTAR